MKKQHLPITDSGDTLCVAAAVFGVLLTAVNPSLAQTWTQTIAPNQQWVSVASSSDGTKLAATAGPDDPTSTGGIFTSADSGATWTQTSAPNKYWGSIASSEDGTKLAAAAAVINAGVIFTSADSGATWTQTSAPNEYWYSIACSSDGTRLVAAATGNPQNPNAGAIFTSSNSGATWSQTSAPAEEWLCVASSSDGTKLAAAGANTSIYTSIDSGTTWTQTPTPLETWYSIAYSSDGTKLAASAINSGPIYTSSNSGATWTRTSAPGENWYSIASSSDGTKLVATGGGPNVSGPIYTSANSGATWTRTSAPIEAWRSVASSADGTRLVGAVDGGGIYTYVAAPTGDLQVTIAPSAAVSAGAQWRVDGGEFQNNGATVPNLEPGTHTVNFSTISGWVTPVNQTVLVSVNLTATAIGTYMPQTGSLKVTISPAAAITAGAQWQVDGGTPESSGGTVRNLSVGNHTISFNTVSGWTTPANQTVSIKANSVAKATGTYFILNPFIPVKGTYTGLFYDTNGVELQSSGFFTATTTANGAYSAKIQIAGKVYSFGGKFDVTGATSTVVGGSSPQALHVILQLDFSGGDTLTGQISNGTWTAALTAYRATFNPKTNPAPQVGRYTVCIPGSDNTAASPTGDGYGTVTVNTSGTVTFNGMLGDGTKISQTAMLSKDGQWPFYVSLYAGKGSVLGWLAFLNPALTNGLAAYYPFDGNTGDASGNGNDGTIEGDDSQYALDRFGNPSSLFLNMTDPSNNVLESYVVASRSARFDFNQDFTASVLVNIDPGLPPFHVHNLVSDGPDSTSANLRVISAADGTNDYLQFVGVPLGGGVDIHTFLTPLRNTWEQVVVVRSGTNFSLFQNGTLVTVTNATATMQDGSDIWIGGMPLSINETPSFGEYPLDGGIAEVRMYNRALSPLELQQLYLTLIGKDVGGFVSWIKSPIPNAKYYPVGFTNETGVIGSKYVFYSQYAFAHGVYPALSFTNGQVWLAGGNLTEGFTNQISFRTNRVANLSTNISPTNSPKLNLTITGSSGLFSGTVINPLTGKVISINGVLLQNENCGTGYFLGTNQSGRVFFGP